MISGTKARWQTLPAGCGPWVKDRVEAAPCYHLLPSLSPRQQRTMTDKPLKAGVSVSHCATALLCWGLAPFAFDSMLSFWMLDSIPCGCYQHHLFDCSPLLPSAQLSWGSPLSLLPPWCPPAPSPSFSTTSIPCFSAFPRRFLEPQLRQMGKGWMVTAEGGAVGLILTTFLLEKGRGKMTHFHLFFPPKVHDEVYAIEERISHTQMVQSSVPSVARTHCNDVQTPCYCLQLSSLSFCIALSFLTLN